MSVTFYVVQNQKNKNMYYKRASGASFGGWVEGIQKGSVWGSKTGPAQIVAMMGKDNAKIVTTTCIERHGEAKTVYLIRHIITGQFVATKKSRGRGKFYTDKWADTGIWNKYRYAKKTIDAWTKFCKHPCMLKYNLDITPNQLEIVKTEIFIPLREDL